MFSLFGCGKNGQVMDGDGMVREVAYAQISQDEAKLMMQDDVWKKKKKILKMRN